MMKLRNSYGMATFVGTFVSTSVASVVPTDIKR